VEPVSCSASQLLEIAVKGEIPGLPVTVPWRGGN